MKRTKRNNKGFSLVELIIVIAIMAILAGVLAPQFVKYIGRSRISTDIQNAQQIATAISAEFADTARTTAVAEQTITDGKAKWDGDRDLAFIVFTCFIFIHFVFYVYKCFFLIAVTVMIISL